MLWITIVYLFIFLFNCFIISGLFYPFGNEDIENPSVDDGSSNLVLLEEPFVYFGHVYQQVYVRA